MLENSLSKVVQRIKYTYSKNLVSFRQLFISTFFNFFKNVYTLKISYPVFLYNFWPKKGSLFSEIYGSSFFKNFLLFFSSFSKNFYYFLVVLLKILYSFLVVF